MNWETFLDDVKNVLLNILSDVIGAGVVWIAAIILVVGASAARRWRQVRFFGVRRTAQSILVLLSSIYVKPYGSIGPDGKGAGFYGQATPGYEIDAVVPLVGIWRNDRLDRLSAATRRRLARLWWPMASIAPSVAASPSDISELHSDVAVLSVGGPAYNTCTKYLFDAKGLPLRIGGGLSVDRMESGQVVESWHYDAGSDEEGATDFGLVQRFSDPHSHTTYFVVAGLTKVGTTGAANFLAAHWNTLARLYDTDDFAICLQFDRVFLDPAAYLSAVVIYASQETRRLGLPRWEQRAWGRIARSPDRVATSAQLPRYTRLESDRPPGPPTLPPSTTTSA